MSDSLKARLAAALNATRPRDTDSPRVVRNGNHTVVKGPPDPLRPGFASSGKEPQTSRLYAVAE